MSPDMNTSFGRDFIDEDPQMVIQGNKRTGIQQPKNNLVQE